MARLGDLCDIRNGYVFKSDKYVNDGVRIIRIANVQKGYIEDTSPVYYSVDDINAQKYALHEGDLLISLTGNVGRVGILTEQFLPAALNQRVANIVVKDNRLLDKSFLFHLLNSDTFENKCIFSANGVAQKNLSTDWLKEVEIPLPPIDEQRKIAAVLDKISDLTAKRRRQLDKLDELVKSRFMEQFGDYNADTPLGKICTQRPQNGFYRKGSEIDGNIPIVKMKQLFGVESMEKATDCDLVAMTETERKKFRLTPQDLLFGRRSLVLDGAGKCRRAGNITGEMVFESSLLRVSLDEAVMRPRFLQHWFDTDDGINAIIAIRSVTTIAGIKGSDLACVKVPVPPIQLQDKFLDFVTQIDKIQSTIQCSLSTIDMLKKSLMQEYFSVR